VDSPTPYFQEVEEDCLMTRKRGLRRSRKRQSYSREFRREAVQMVLDGHSVTSVAERLVRDELPKPFAYNGA
jgi:hypothetical protein